MVSVLPPDLTEEQIAFRKALLADPELLRFLPEVDKPTPKRQPRILPDLMQQNELHPPHLWS